MVSLQTLNGGTPGSKLWLNIVANSIETNNVYQKSTENILTTTPVTLTPSQWVNSIIFANGGGGGNVIDTPSADELKNFFGGTKPDGFTFNVDIYKTNVVNLTVNFGAGVVDFALGKSGLRSLTVTPGPLGYNIRFVMNAGIWVAYYLGSNTYP